jgi:hypothetical protein
MRRDTWAWSWGTDQLQEGLESETGSEGGRAEPGRAEWMEARQAGGSGAVERAPALSVHRGPLKKPLSLPPFRLTLWWSSGSVGPK